MGGGAWPFLVGGVICLLNCVNERDLDLLNSPFDFGWTLASQRDFWLKPMEVRGNNRLTCTGLLMILTVESCIRPAAGTGNALGADPVVSLVTAETHAKWQICHVNRSWYVLNPQCLMGWDF